MNNLFFDVEDFLQFVELVIDDDGAVDVKGGGGLVAACPGFDLLAGAGGGGDIHLGVGDFVIGEPAAGFLAVGAPAGAVHDDAAMGEGHWLGFGFLRTLAHLGVELTDGSTQNGVAGLVVDVVDIYIADGALLVNDENGSFSYPVRAQDAILLGNFAVRPEIAQQGVIYSTQVLSPGNQGGDRVNTYTQNLGIQSRELGLFDLIQRDLSRSYGRPGGWKECQDYVRTAQVAECDRLSQVGREGEIRGGGSDR